MSVPVLVRGGRVVDPTQALDDVRDVLIEDGELTAVATGIEEPPGATVVDATGKIVTPGLVDVHVHFRDPGFTGKETLDTGTRSAVAGGFTAVCCMPNTDPALDTPERVADIIDRASSLPARVYPIGTISVGRAGEELADIRGMAQAGAIGFSDDGDSTKSSAVMRQALEIAGDLGLPVMVHCEDWTLIQGGAINEGAVSEELGLPGLTAAAEEIIIGRDIELARLTGGWLHVLHVSTERGRDLVRQAIRAGWRVTAEVMPHHLLMTDHWVAGRRRFVGDETVHQGLSPDPNAKVNPPLRTESDARALREGLIDGTFEILATDHAPHAESDKPVELRLAASGMIGLEVAVPLMLELVRQGDLSLSLLVDRLSSSPARLFNLPGGSLKPGGPGDVTVIDPEHEWNVRPETIASKSKNTPLLGMDVMGRATTTIRGGEIVHNV